MSPARRRVVDKRRSLKAVRRRTPTVSRGRKAAVLGALGHGRRTPPGSASGACLQRGSSGTWESPRSPCHLPGMGDRVTTSPGVVWGPRPGQKPVRDTTHEPQRTRDREASDKRSDLRGAGWPSERSRVPGKGGNGGPREPREGRQRRASRGAGQTDGRDGAITNRPTQTPGPGGAGRPRSGPGVHDPGLPDGSRRSAGGVPPNEHVECRRDRGGDGAALGRTPRREPARRARATPPWLLPGSARRACRDGTGRRGSGSAWEADVRGQDGPESGGHAAGSERRARRRRRLVGRSARTSPPQGTA